MLGQHPQDVTSNPEELGGVEQAFRHDVAVAAEALCEFDRREPAGLTGKSAAGGWHGIRLSTLSRLWSTVSFLHPAVHRALDWDREFVRCLQRLDDPGADGPAELGALLRTLGDPATRIEPSAAAPRPRSGRQGRPRLHRPEPGVAVIVAGDFAGSHLDLAVPGLLAAMIEEARAVGVLVLDLRNAPWWFGRHLPEALGPLLSCDVGLPAERFRFHSGWASERADSSGGLFSGSMVKDAEVVAAAATVGPRPRLIMVVNEHSGLPLRVARRACFGR